MKTFENLEFTKQSRVVQKTIKPRNNYGVNDGTMPKSGRHVPKDKYNKHKQSIYNFLDEND